MVIMSGAQSGDYMQGLSGLAGELGADPRILGVLDRGKALLRDNKHAEYAMQTAIEFLPVPLIVEKLVPAPTPVLINSGDTYLVAPELQLLESNQWLLYKKRSKINFYKFVDPQGGTSGGVNTNRVNQKGNNN